MALDKQKILNELGSVVNQLQSADCGCMGKLFSNSEPKPLPCCGCVCGCRNMRSCCDCRNSSACGQPIYNSPCAGEPCTGVRRCMGFCNPPKLYADTYNYLNHNMMQPVVREVYDDLKSITPGNTIMNNAMGAQMGLSPSNPGNIPPQNAMPGGMPGNQSGMFTCPMHGNTPMPRTRFGNVGMNNPNFAQMNHPNPQQGMGQIGQDMGHIDPGSGQMGQPGKEMAHTGPMGHEMGQMGQEMGQGMGHMGHGMVQPGQGMGQMGHGMVQPGQGMGHMGHGMAQPGQGMGHMGQEMGQMGQGMGNMAHEMANSGGMMAGMGPQIVNMMGSARKNNMPNQGGTPPNATGDMPPPRDMGHMAPNMHGDANPGHYHHGHMHNHAGHMEMAQGDPRMQPNPHMSQPNAFPGAPPNVQSNAMPGNMNRMGPPSQQMGNMNPNPNPYGQHGAGMAKFNQMFPGVMKGDLGFDPMAIAIQMNPANQQKNAMDTMQKMLMNNANTAGISRIMDTTGKASSMMQPVINATNAAAASIAQPNQQMPNQAPGQQNIPQQQAPGGATIQNQQQVYTALTPAPTMEQQQIPPQQMIPHEQQQWQQQQSSPDQSQRLEAVQSSALPTVYEGSGDPNARQQQPPVAERIYREPILPADTSRNLLHSHHFLKPQRFFDYNTLGQPVEMTPIRHPTELPNQPQTLSPQPAPTRFSNVKSTVSKTALMGNRPVGRTPSRSQLQQVYNQYKGSHSYTQQNIRPSARNGSFSEGHINIPQGNVPAQPPIENIERNGGDTAANNQMRQMDQVGDVPAGKKLPEDYAMTPARTARLRNGLQDQVYTAYPTSAKWSFHGSTPAPFSPGYRIKNK